MVYRLLFLTWQIFVIVPICYMVKTDKSRYFPERKIESKKLKNESTLKINSKYELPI